MCVLVCFMDREVTILNNHIFYLWSKMYTTITMICQKNKKINGNYRYFRCCHPFVRYNLEKDTTGTTSHFGYNTSFHLDYNILSNLHYLGSPLGFCTLIFDLMRNLYIYKACIYIYSIFNWDGWRCWWTDFVPEAIHNPVAIKLLVSGLLTWLILDGSGFHQMKLMEAFLRKSRRTI